MLSLLPLTRGGRQRVRSNGKTRMGETNSMESIVHATIEQGYSICGIHPALREEDHKFVSVNEIKKVTCPHCLKRYYKEG